MALSRFVTGVTVVTTTGPDNRPAGITVNAFSSVSLEPPLVLACVDKRASVHDYLTEGRHFAVNILAEDQEHLYPGGDHTIIVGEVETASVAEHKPLAYHRGRYTQLA